MYEDDVIMKKILELKEWKMCEGMKGGRDGIVVQPFAKLDVCRKTFGFECKASATRRSEGFASKLRFRVKDINIIPNQASNDELEDSESKDSDSSEYSRSDTLSVKS